MRGLLSAPANGRIGHVFMAERAKGRELHELPGAGHALTVSQPDAVAETILGAVSGQVQP